ncbi:MAG: cytochrome P450 [Solirubrobacteraceae bacterium]
MGDAPEAAATGNTVSNEFGCPTRHKLQQLRALARAVALTVGWAWPLASRELEYWQARATAIPDAALREDALHSLKEKRDNALGAALFCILPKRRNRTLLRLLVVYQTLWDFLDNLSESGVACGAQNGYTLHRALVEALDPDTPVSDYYQFHSAYQDGGYLQELVAVCRHLCSLLPSYPSLRRAILAGVWQCALQGLNHLADREQRTKGLRAWASQSAFKSDELSWFEIAAASSAFLPHPLLAMAAEPKCKAADAKRVGNAYFPWMALAITMLDSYADLDCDRVNGDHSYVSYYDTRGIACERLCEIVSRLVAEMDRLPSRDTHVLMAASMVAMYLSSGFKAGSPQVKWMNKRIAASGGRLTQILVPVASTWRILGGGGKSSRQRPVQLPPSAPLSPTLQTALFWRSPFVYLSYCRRRYGSRFTLNATTHPPLVFLSDASDIRTLVAAPENDLRAGEGGATVSPIVGERSFMLSDGEPHRHGRKTVVAAFHRQTVRRHGDVVANAAQRALASWPTDETVAVHDKLRAITLEVILRSLTGRLEGALDERVELLHRRVLEMLAVTQSATLVEPRLRYGPGRRVWRRFQYRRAQTDELLNALIADRQHLTDSGDDLLSQMASLPGDDGVRDSAQRLRDNAMSLILAGHETTAAQLAWAFQLLAYNPSVRDRLIREIDADRTDEYLTATLQEVLRHRCVFVFSIPRAVAKPVEIGGWAYTPPAQILACIYLLHHDAAIYRDPYAFRPERFLESPPDPRTWIPWGGGRKRCPGLHLAMMEMKIVLRTVLRERTPHAAARRMERPRWRSVIVAPHAGSRVLLSRRR